MIKNTEFYDRASGDYSKIRYPATINSYTQYFFKNRLKLVISLIEKHTKSLDRQISVLEVGCADGIVLASVYERFKNKLSGVVGVDISSKMIDTAKNNYSHTPIVFKLRGNYESSETLHDLIIEIGVINYANISEEIKELKNKIKKDGIIILSYAATNSLWNKIKNDSKGFNNFLSYEEFEKELKKYFKIEKQIGVGLFIPVIWKVPFLARIIQSIIELLFNKVWANIFHEKIYLVKKIN